MKRYLHSVDAIAPTWVTLALGLLERRRPISAASRYAAPTTLAFFSNRLTGKLRWMGACALRQV